MRSRFTGDTGFRGALRAVMSRASSVGLACRVSNIRCSGAHRAQELLETTDANIELIAARTGMGTAATLRRHFNRLLGVPRGVPSHLPQ